MTGRSGDQERTAPPAQPSSQAAERKFEAQARAQELNAQLDTSQGLTTGFYDLLISSVVDPKQPGTEEKSTSFAADGKITFGERNK